MNRFVVISGCSGGGKSSLVDELARRGHHVVPEPGRRIVSAEVEAGGDALPWVDAAKFAEKAIATALADRESARSSEGFVFFDRGLVDAVAALEHVTGDTATRRLALEHRYNTLVFMTPPWSAIYVADQERRHGFGEAVAEFDRLLAFYPEVGYRLSLLPQVGVAERADLVLRELSRP